jgi:chromosome segregation ATPase
MESTFTRATLSARAVGENQRGMGIDEIIDRLYGLPLEEFTRERNQAERELRKAGESAQAEQLKSLRKPTAAAAAVNRLVRSHRDEVDAFLRAAATLRDAQFAGKGDLAAAARAERNALEELVGLGGESVRPSLQAAAVDDEIAAELLRARLVREPEPAGFGTLLAHAGRTAPTPRTATSRPAAKPRRDDSAARARLQEAKQAVRALEAEERQARQRVTQIQRDLEKAQAAVEKAQRDLDRVRSR